MTTHFITFEVAEVPQGSRFSADCLAISHSTPLKSNGCMTFDKHARQAKRSLYGVMVTALSAGGSRKGGKGGLGQGRIDVTGKPEIQKLSFLSY